LCFDEPFWWFEWEGLGVAVGEEEPEEEIGPAPVMFEERARASTEGRAERGGLGDIGWRRKGIEEKSSMSSMRRREGGMKKGCRE
jgi:hypothetical protein